MNNPILEELYRVRDANAAKFNYDPKAIFLDMKQREEQSIREGRAYAPAPVHKQTPVRQLESTYLTARQSYLAMFEFLRQRFERGLCESDELGGLLGGMSLLEDGTTADPAVGGDWDVAVNTVLKSEAENGGNHGSDFAMKQETSVR